MSAMSGVRKYLSDSLGLTIEPRPPSSASTRTPPATMREAVGRHNTSPYTPAVPCAREILRLESVARDHVDAVVHRRRKPNAADYRSLEMALHVAEVVWHVVGGEPVHHRVGVGSPRRDHPRSFTVVEGAAERCIR